MLPRFHLQNQHDRVYLLNLKFVIEISDLIIIMLLVMILWLILVQFLIYDYLNIFNINFGMNIHD